MPVDLDQFFATRTALATDDEGRPVQVTSLEGVRQLMALEGVRLTAYRCQANILTIGVGHTGPDVTEGQEIDEETAAMLLANDLKRFERAVRENIERPMAQHEFDAFVCFAFNIGVAGFASSSARRKFNAGETSEAAHAMKLWNKVRQDGVLVRSHGLTMRREVEAHLMLTGLYDDNPYDGVPAEQAVPPAAPQRPPGEIREDLNASRTVQNANAGILASVGGLGAIFASALGPVREMMDQIPGVDPAFAGVAVVAFALAVTGWTALQSKRARFDDHQAGRR